MASERLEGSGPSKLVQAIKKFGYNKDVDFLFATVTSAPPNLKIKLDNVPIDLDADDLLVLEHLTAHKRKTKLTSSTVNAALSASGSPSHSHGLSSLIIEGEIEFTDELKVGDRVMVAEINQGQTFLILDRVVRY